MKLICPRCGAGNRIGWQTRYQFFNCSSCDLMFFGLEAYTSWGSFLLDDPSQTGCPHCWKPIRLMPDFQNGGWYGPERCSSCGKKLPRRPEYSWQEREARSEQADRELREEQARPVPTPQAPQPRVQSPKPKKDKPIHEEAPAPTPVRRTETRKSKPDKAAHKQAPPPARVRPLSLNPHDALARLCARYIDSVKGYMLQVRQSGSNIEPDERLMRLVEEGSEVSEGQKDEFRRQIMNQISALEIEGKAFEHSTDDRLCMGLILAILDQEENIGRWKAAGEPWRWVEAHKGQWNHQDWLALIVALKKSDYWPMDPNAVGIVLEEAKKESQR